MSLRPLCDVPSHVYRVSTLQIYPMYFSLVFVFMWSVFSFSVSRGLCVTVHWGHGRSETSDGGSCCPADGSFPCSGLDPGPGLGHRTVGPGQPGSAWPDSSGSPCVPTPGRRLSILGLHSRLLRSSLPPPAAHLCRGPRKRRAPGRGSQTSWHWIGPLVRERKINLFLETGCSVEMACSTQRQLQTPIRACSLKFTDIRSWKQCITTQRLRDVHHHEIITLTSRAHALLFGELY